MISVLLDTSFFIRLLNSEDPLHENAKGYYKYFLEEEIKMKISTISIAEYCVKGDITDLPLKNLMILPFNYDHGQKAGAFAKTIYEIRNKEKLVITPRILIPNDKTLCPSRCRKFHRRLCFVGCGICKNIRYFKKLLRSKIRIHRLEHYCRTTIRTAILRSTSVF